MPKSFGSADSLDESLHEESKIEQDVHAKGQVNGERIDDVEKTGGKAARTKAEKAQENGSDEGTEVGDEDALDEEDFEVEEITAHKFLDGEALYHIHWKGYDKKKDYTWEPTENLLPSARDILAKYHKAIGGEPKPQQSLKKSKSTQSLRRQSTEDSPAPKRRKTDDVETWRPKREDWEPDVEAIDTIERDESGQLLVYVLFKNGKKIKVSMEQVYKHCPRPMLRFYESHLHFKSAEEPSPEDDAFAYS